ncbi:MAG: hypothetical protein PUP91_08480 [Rhizonema sp. PD37]|nr:hypothetical protein [Rhizonema sp. PD37]
MSDYFNATPYLLLHLPPLRTASMSRWFDSCDSNDEFITAIAAI